MVGTAKQCYEFITRHILRLYLYLTPGHFVIVTFHENEEQNSYLNLPVFVLFLCFLVILCFCGVVCVSRKWRVGRGT